MSAETRAACALGISDETLSTLRDELLSADEAGRLRSHAATCAACRERLEGFERVGVALRGQRLTGPSARLWDDVQAAIAAGEHTSASGRFAWRTGARASRPTWSGWGALAAALVVALLFGLVLRGALVGRGGKTTQVQPTATVSPTSAVTPVPTATTVPPLRVPPPDWKQYVLPQGYYLDFPTSTLTVAPSNGNVAYMCGGNDPASPQLARVLVTHDRGAHWTRVSDVAVGSTCNPLAVDESNPNNVVVGEGQYMFLSTDGGLSWQPFPGRQDMSQHVISIAQLAWSASGRAYALLGTLDFSKHGDGVYLAVSDDGLRTWRRIDGGIVEMTGGVDDGLRRFWMNPTNGHLLVATSYSFWTSADGGQTWSRMAASGIEAELYVVQPPSGSSDWHICSPLTCTTNGGQTWTTLPQLLPPLSDGSNPGEFAVAITSDGSLLATDLTDLYRLPPNSQRWEDLGLLPAPPPWSGFSPLYAPVQGTSGALWALPPGGKGAFTQYYSAPLPASS
jgi:hypothetical protein